MPDACSGGPKIEDTLDGTLPLVRAAQHEVEIRLLEFTIDVLHLSVMELRWKRLSWTTLSNTINVFLIVVR